MKNILLLLGLLCISCKQNHMHKSVSITAGEVEIVKDLIQESFDHIWGGLDSTKITQYHTNDFVILEQGEIWTNKEIKAYIKNRLKRINRPKRINKMDFISIEKYGNAINMAYHNYATFVQEDSIVGKAQWLESALAIKVDNEWKLKMMHSTRVNMAN